MSDVYRWYLGGLLATGRDLRLVLRPHLNSYKRYQPDSWAPTAVVWGLDNRTLGLRLVGHGEATAVESRIPGADANPYLAYAATIAAALHGIEQRARAPGPFEGNGYEASDVPRVPTTLVEAIELCGGRRGARAFGDEVHHHLVNTAEQEWLESNRW